MCVYVQFTWLVFFRNDGQTTLSHRWVIAPMKPKAGRQAGRSLKIIKRHKNKCPTNKQQTDTPHDITYFTTWLHLAPHVTPASSHFYTLDFKFNTEQTPPLSLQSNPALPCFFFVQMQPMTPPLFVRRLLSFSKLGALSQIANFLALL